MNTSRKTPFSFTVTVDAETAATLAFHAGESPAAYAAAVLVTAARMAKACHVTPLGLVHEGVASLVQI